MSINQYRAGDIPSQLIRLSIITDVESIHSEPSHKNQSESVILYYLHSFFTILSTLKHPLHSQSMNYSQSDDNDMLSNVLLKSRGPLFTDITRPGIDTTNLNQPSTSQLGTVGNAATPSATLIAKYDYRLNYGKAYKNPQEYAVSYIDAIANLQEINNEFKRRIVDKNLHYNFFLDDSEDPTQENPIDFDLFTEYIEHLQKQELYAYITKNTWSKGKQFFFVEKGTIMRVVTLHPDRVFVNVSYRGQVGLMRFDQLKIIKPD